MKTEVELGDNLDTEEWYSMIMISLHITVSCKMGSCLVMHVVYLVGVCTIGVGTGGGGGARALPIFYP